MLLINREKTLIGVSALTPYNSLTPLTPFFRVMNIVQLLICINK